VAVAFVGLLGVVSALTPEVASRVDLIGAVVPSAAREMSRALVAVGSLMLVVDALSLRRGKRPAWRLAVLLLAGTTALQLAKGLDVEEAAVTGGLLVALMRERGRFTVEADPTDMARIVRHAAGLLGGAVLLAVALIESQRELTGHTLHPVEALREAAYDYAGLGPEHLTGDGNQFVPWTLVVYLLAAAAWLAYLWLRPRREVARQTFADRADARRLVERYGDRSLDYFTLRRDKSYFFSPARDAVLAYRVINGVALIAGDPVGNPHAYGDLLDGFSDYTRRHGWRLAAIGIDEALRDTYESRGYRTVYLGDEALIDPRRFSLEGRAMRKIRQSCTRLGKAGYSVEVFRQEELPAGMRPALKDISRRWLGDQHERGFSMALDDIWSDEHRDTVIVVAFASNRAPSGFLYLVPYRHKNGLSLAAMRRLPDTPNGLMEYLISELASWAAEHDVAEISLNFNALARILRSETQDLPRWARSARRLLEHGDRYFQLDRLYSFNKKFDPRWQPRYAAYERPSDLPIAALALLSAESLIPRPAFKRRYALRASDSRA
jgi:lysyl-tRNA synthetase class 2